MKTIQKIWHAIYPADHEHKWMPLMWLPFMLWFFLDPYWKHASPLHWTWNTLLVCSSPFSTCRHFRGMAESGILSIVTDDR